MKWPISLDSPPEVVALAKNLHGFQKSERFLLRELWSLHLYAYTADLVVDGHPLQIKPGRIGICPPGVIVEYRYSGLSPHIYAHFRMPWGSHEISAMTDLGDRFESVQEQLLQVMGSEPGRINARVWDILWSLQGSPDAQSAAKSLPQLAAEQIDRHLSESLTVAALAKSAGVSHEHLSRIFKAEFGMTVIAFIRRRRMDQAAHLLRHTTLPVKVVAASVGIPDLQQFNKAIRAQFGASPREIQRRSIRSASSES